MRGGGCPLAHPIGDVTFMCGSFDFAAHFGFRHGGHFGGAVAHHVLHAINGPNLAGSDAAVSRSAKASITFDSALLSGSFNSLAMAASKPWSMSFGASGVWDVFWGNIAVSSLAKAVKKIGLDCGLGPRP